MGELATSSRLIKPKSINRDVAGGEKGVNSFICKASTDVCERPPVKPFPFFLMLHKMLVTKRRVDLSSAFGVCLCHLRVIRWRSRRLKVCLLLVCFNAGHCGYKG